MFSGHSVTLHTLHQCVGLHEDLAGLLVRHDNVSPLGPRVRSILSHFRVLVKHLGRLLNVGASLVDLHTRHRYVKVRLLDRVVRGYLMIHETMVEVANKSETSLPRLSGMENAGTAVNKVEGDIRN